MKIAHVVPLVTPGGVYGGPVTVALNQLEELSSRGHEVLLLGGASGYAGDVPEHFGSVPARLFPARSIVPGTGFAGLFSAGLLRHLRTEASSFDVVHVHLARDLLTLPVAWVVARSSASLVVQPHGMVDRSDRRSAAVLDALLTRRVVGSSQAVMTLTPEEEFELEELGVSRDLFVRVVNGIAPRRQSVEPLTVQGREVLFLARLHPRKRAAMFAQMAATLAPEYPDVRFTIVGPDEGEGETVMKVIESSSRRDQISWEGGVPPEDVRGRMARAEVYVLPSIREVFPMSVLEALSEGIPVVITSSNGLAERLRSAGAACVTDETLASLVAEVRKLLDDGGYRKRISENGKVLVNDIWGMTVVGDTLERVYSSGIRRPM